MQTATIVAPPSAPDEARPPSAWPAKPEPSPDDTWGLTLEGCIIAAAEATSRYVDDPTPARAYTMERRYDLCEAVTWRGAV